MARPQIHGYDLFCIASISPTTFATGAEEKPARAFSAPRDFLLNFHHLSGAELVGEFQDVTDPPYEFFSLRRSVIFPSEEKEDASKEALGASVPALGLSNKAVYSTDLEKDLDRSGSRMDSFPQYYYQPVSLTGALSHLPCLFVQLGRGEEKL